VARNAPQADRINMVNQASATSEARMPTAEEYKDQIERLDKYARRLGLSLEGLNEDAEPKKEGDGSFKRDTEWTLGYPLWYAEAREVVKFLLPDHLAEFESLYLAEPKRKDIDHVNYTIQDWLLGRRAVTYVGGRKDFDEVSVISMKFLSQMQILAACNLRFDSILLNIRKLTLADLFDNELDGAREVLKAGFERSAGVIARVVLEKHLKDVCETHKVKVPKRGKQPPGLADFYNALKKEEVIDFNQWRKIEYLAGITNYCCHKKERDPTKEEVLRLLDGAEETIKTIF
jgi:hypothetical protein